ncbi:hypothetical protein EDD21DRAFT_118330 [Dissophora ornata]|nr:hypothetical protein EDD21DRAFT_118330 [Dissophora ornata]
MTEPTHSKRRERPPGNRRPSEFNSPNRSSTASRHRPPIHSQGAWLINLPEEKVRPSREQPRPQKLVPLKKQGDSGTNQAVKGSRIFVDAQGQPLQICISRTVKDISNLENKIRTHGGEVTNDDKMAFICLADPGLSYLQTTYSMYSTEWVHHCVQQEALVHHDTPAFRLKKANRNDKTHFTLEQDCLLREFIEAKKRDGARLNGNLIYEEFSNTHKEHSWQSWKYRAVTGLKLTESPESQSIYESSKAQREEKLRKHQDLRTPVHHDPLSEEKMPRTLQNTTTKPSPKVTSISDDEDNDKSNQSATQHMSPEILDFNDIPSDDEEDQFHKKMMLDLRRTSRTVQWSRAEPVSDENRGDDVADRAGPSQPADDMRPSRSRYLSHSPTKARSNGGNERQEKARRTRLSLPSMTARLGESPSMQRQAAFVALIPKKSAESSDIASRFSPKSLNQYSSTQRSWRNPPQDNLSIPESFSVPLPLPAEDTDDSQPLARASAEFDEIELVDEDDIAIERMIQTKMFLSHPTPSNLHELESASRSCSEDRFQEQENDQEDSSTHYTPDSLGQLDGDSESFHGFELPTKLLAGRTSSPGRRKSANKAAATSPSQSKDALTTRGRSASHETQEELTAITDTEPIDESMQEVEHEAEIKISASQKEEEKEEVHHILSLSSVDAVEIKVSASQAKRSREAMRRDPTCTDPIEKEEEEQEEERLLRRRLDVKSSPVSQNNKSLLEWNQIKKEPTVGRTRKQDAVHEFYADDMRLMYYLKNLYREEIATLMFFELVHPLRAIDTLDACSGDLKLARTIINHGITNEIQSRFWTREDDEKVFSKVKEDEIALVKKHSLIEIALRYQYLSKTRADAERLPVSMEAIQAPALQRKRPTAPAMGSKFPPVTKVARGSSN